MNRETTILMLVWCDGRESEKTWFVTWTNRHTDTPDCKSVFNLQGSSFKSALWSDWSKYHISHSSTWLAALTDNFKPNTATTEVTIPTPATHYTFITLWLMTVTLLHSMCEINMNKRAIKSHHSQFSDENSNKVRRILIWERAISKKIYFNSRKRLWTVRCWSRKRQLDLHDSHTGRCVSYFQFDFYMLFTLY